MESQRYAFKLFAEPAANVPSHDLVLFFHRVIQDRLLDETTVDVTDYSHVPNGPGVMLICHEAHYSMDRGEGLLGLKCATKRGATGDARARLRRVIGKTLRAAAALEKHEILGGRLRFDTKSALFSIEDRLVAPPTDESFAAIAPALGEQIQALWGATPALARTGTAKECFQVRISVPDAPPLADIASRL
jgi:hypothetical protein